VIVRVKRRPDWRAEDEPMILPGTPSQPSLLFLSLLMVQECRDHRSRKLDRSPTLPARLPTTNDHATRLAAEGLADRNLALLQIDVLPRKPESFSGANPGSEHQHIQGRKTIAHDGLKQLFGLFDGE